MLRISCFCLDSFYPMTRQSNINSDSKRHLRIYPSRIKIQDFPPETYLSKKKISKAVPGINDSPSNIAKSTSQIERLLFTKQHFFFRFFDVLKNSKQEDWQVLVKVPENYGSIIYYWENDRHWPCFKVTKPGSYFFSPLGRMIRTLPLNQQVNDVAVRFLAKSEAPDNKKYQYSNVTIKWHIEDLEGVQWLKDIPEYVKSTVSWQCEVLDTKKSALVDNKDKRAELCKHLIEKVNCNLKWWSIKVDDLKLEETTLD